MRAPLGTAMELDETICKRPVCQHPQCWVTMRRIEQGHPRLRPPTARRPPQDEGGLPILSVSTLPASGVLHRGSDSPHLSEGASSTTVCTSAATCSMEKFFFPGVNSYREILAPSRSSGSSFSSWKPRKVEILRPSFQDAKRDVTMVWVPNAQHRPPRKEDGEKHLKVWIKDLTLSDPLGGMRREKPNPALTINRKQTKLPSGGCPLNLTLVGSSSHTKKFIEAREVQEQPGKALKCRRRQRDPWPDSDSVTSPSLSGIMVGNRRVILHDTREKCPAVPHTGPVYRLDNQQSAAPNNTAINLDSIRSQYYLWKKYIYLADPSHRIKPPDHRANRIQRSHKSSAPDQLSHIGLFPCDPDSALSYYKSQALETPTGSVVCDTTRSRDSEDRNSPSLAGLSQRSWSDEEPSGTPTETGDRIQQEIPGEINKEAKPAKPPELDVPRDEESMRPNMSCDQSESAMETTDTQENPGGTTSSPQPNPPPPSPMN
ncbi:uncharacterized protein C9orf43 homolog [Hyla sarda]|uniref:uncharacterized protein C9orf43 homolog n=1 Tax=Hyla sarda TaxID=327740 RepID=UPI0024C3C6EC|nr:uncharacterized protein C9orf43 homolog [Hyla sarda]